jgi:phosphosulfolactate phosphohydrolase-like enzyme
MFAKLWNHHSLRQKCIHKCVCPNPTQIKKNENILKLLIHKNANGTNIIKRMREERLLLGTSCNPSVSCKYGKKTVYT